MRETQARIDEELVTAGFTKIREDAAPHRLMWQVRCSIDGCVAFQNRVWNGGTPGEVYLKQVRRSGWLADFGRKPRCPAHSHSHSKSISEAVSQPAKGEFGSKLSVALQTSASAPTLARAAPQPVQVIACLADEPAPLQARAVVGLFKADKKHIEDEPEPQPQEQAVSSPATTKTQSSSPRQFTKDMRALDELLEVAKGVFSKAGDYIGIGGGAISNYKQEGQWPVTSMLAAKYVTSQRKKASAGDQTLILNVSEEMTAAVKGITESHGGTIAQSNGLYQLLLIPSDKLEACKKICLMLPNVQFVGTV